MTKNDQISGKMKIKESGIQTKKNNSNHSLILLIPDGFVARHLIAARLRSRKKID
jgi:hypothetical protein